IPHALEGRDVMGLAQTGTGKTAAFGLPLIEVLTRAGIKPAPKTARGLILAPTRELAGQIAQALTEWTAGSHLSVTKVVGGASLNAQAKRLARGNDLLVATPGRLIDLLDRGAIYLDATQFLVLDEADQMLDMGFIHALRRIAPLLSRKRQTMLFSATMPKQMEELAATYLNDPVRVQVSPPGKPADKVEHAVHFLAQSEKTALLTRLLSRHPDELALVFGRTKHGSERLMKQLVAAGFDAASVHGNKSQGQRERALASFRTGHVKVLVATDVAARGLDIPDVRHVYNYDLPNVPENYVHRIGRTARAGRDGAAISFCSEAEIGELRDIEKVLGTPIETAGGERWTGPAPKGRPGRGPKRGGKPSAGSSQKPGAKPGTANRRRTGKPRRPRRAA
ncbi:MAG: DEAD/DEAH box helicase, partial [Pseudomonadota bacterium]